jgi:hypothetical protein
MIALQFGQLNSMAMLATTKKVRRLVGNSPGRALYLYLARLGMTGLIAGVE